MISIVSASDSTDPTKYILYDTMENASLLSVYYSMANVGDLSYSTTVAKNGSFSLKLINLNDVNLDAKIKSTIIPTNFNFPFCGDFDYYVDTLATTSNSEHGIIWIGTWNFVSGFLPQGSTGSAAGNERRTTINSNFNSTLISGHINAAQWYHYKFCLFQGYSASGNGIMTVYEDNVLFSNASTLRSDLNQMALHRRTGGNTYFDNMRLWNYTLYGENPPQVNATGILQINNAQINSPIYFNSSKNCSFNMTDTISEPLNASITWYQNTTGSFINNATYNFNIVNVQNNTLTTTNSSSGSYTGILNVTNQLICQITGTNGLNSTIVNTSSLSIISTLLSILNLGSSPAQITSTNIFSNPINISVNYTIANSFSNNNNSYILFYHVNSSSSNCNDVINGTPQDCSFEQKNYSSNISSTYLFKIFDNDLYPEYSNIHSTIVDNLPHLITTVNGAAQIVKEEYLGINPNKNYSFYEIMANTSSGANINIYYCNSSYTTGSPAVSSNCNNFFSIAATGTYNHTHLNQSCHQLIPMTIIGGNIGTVKVTSTSQILIRGSGGLWNIYYVNQSVRANQVQTSTNTGAAYTSQTWTTDGHIHQFDNTSQLFYYACGSGLENYNICTQLFSQSITLANLPPSPGIIIQPNSTGIYCKNINITWHPGQSSSTFVQNYNMTYNYENLSQIGIVSSFLGEGIGAAPNVILSTTFNSTLAGLLFSNYTLHLTTVDHNGLSSSSFSEPFTIDNVNPILNITSPINNFTYNLSTITNNLNFSVIDNTSLSCNFTLNGDSFPLPNCSNNTFFASNGINNITVYVSDGCGNVASQSIIFTANLTLPQKIILFNDNSIPRVILGEQQSTSSINTGGCPICFNATLYYSTSQIDGFFYDVNNNLLNEQNARIGNDSLNIKNNTNLNYFLKSDFVNNSGQIISKNFTIGSNTLNSSEFSFLDGVNQSLTTSSPVKFPKVEIGSVGTIDQQGTDFIIYNTPVEVGMAFHSNGNIDIGVENRNLSLTGSVLIENLIPTQTIQMRDNRPIIFGNNGEGTIRFNLSGSKNWDFDMNGDAKNIIFNRFFMNTSFIVYGNSSEALIKADATTKIVTLAHQVLIPNTGTMGIGIAPDESVLLKLKAGTAGTVPIQFTAGGDTTSPKSGAIEYSTGLFKFRADNVSFIQNIFVNKSINFTGDLSTNDKALFFNGTSHNLDVAENITAKVYHGMIDWVYTIIGMSGNTSCDNLDNKIAGYAYTCQTCIDTSGTTVSCSTTLITLNANCGCKID